MEKRPGISFSNNINQKFTTTWIRAAILIFKDCILVDHLNLMIFSRFYLTMNQPGKTGEESDAVYPVQSGCKGTSRLGYGIEGE